MPELKVRSHPGVAAVEAARWDALVGQAPPFLEHAFLASLEDAGCVGRGTGWQPAPLTAWEGDALVGVAPAYLKLHSMGEFVYDWSWAEAAERAGLAYYPKLVVATPFTPVAGPRLLAASHLPPARRRRIRAALLEAALALADDAGCSGVQLLFCTDEERELAESMGFATRLGTQLHWQNEGYRDFDAFLARFKSKRRNQLRRERRRVREQGIEVSCLAGDTIGEEHLPAAYRFYGSTVDRYLWGRRYLNEHFFRLLWDRLRGRLQLVLAEADGRYVAGALNFEKAGRRFGRYWGCDEERHSLHFEVCAYSPIEDCIARGVRVFEAGSGGYGHKLNRGFLPVATYSAHRFFSADFQGAVAGFCAREAVAVAREAEQLRESLFVRGGTRT